VAEQLAFESQEETLHQVGCRQATVLFFSALIRKIRCLSH